MIVICDRQHAGKPDRGPGAGRPEDMGAVMHGAADARYEADITLAYITEAAALLRAAGAVVHVIDPLTTPPRLSYVARHERAKSVARANPDRPVLYLACHMNAGGGDYALCQHDERSKAGRRAADAIGAALADRLPVSRVLIRPTSGDWSRGAPCIAGIYTGPANICAVLVEPLFLDRPEHVACLETDGVKRIAQAIAVGALAWGQT